MQVVVQRVRRAAVAVEGQVVGEIGLGLMALVGVASRSTDEDARWLAGKVAELRVFDDDDGRMNRSVLDVGGAVLAISQFTLYGEVSKGRRPSFAGAAAPEPAAARYERFCGELEARGVPTRRGVFGAHMVIEMVADGPVTLRLEREDGRKQPG